MLFFQKSDSRASSISRGPSPASFSMTPTKHLTPRKVTPAKVTPSKRTPAKVTPTKADGTPAKKKRDGLNKRNAKVCGTVGNIGS